MIGNEGDMSTDGVELVEIGDFDDFMNDNEEEEEFSEVERTALLERSNSFMGYSSNTHTIIDISKEKIVKQAWNEMKREHLLLRFGRKFYLYCESLYLKFNDIEQEEEEEEEEEGQDQEFSHRQRVMMIFCEFLTLFFLACFLFEEQFFYQEWASASNNSEHVGKLLSESFWELMLAVFLTLPVNEALHRLFSRINSIRGTRKKYQTLVLKERVELMHLNVSEMSIRETMVVESKLDVLLRFWKITVQNILETEGEEAYENAIQDRFGSFFSIFIFIYFIEK